MKELFVILLSTILVNNYMLARIMGTCPFIGVSNQFDTAMGMAAAVIFVMSLAAAVTWIVQYYLLIPLGLGFLQTVAFILVIAALVQLIEMIILKMSPTLYRALGIYLPLITTNCAVLGVAVINIRDGYNFIEAVISGTGGGIGFSLVLIAMAALREKLNTAPIAKSFKGFPITLIITAQMAMAFLGFSGFNLEKLFGLR